MAEVRRSRLGVGQVETRKRGEDAASSKASWGPLPVIMFCAIDTVGLRMRTLNKSRVYVCPVCKASGLMTEI